MKKLVLLASLCVVAVVVVPISSASADWFKGKCEITGNATFARLTFNKPTRLLDYNFTSVAIPAGKQGPTSEHFAENKAVLCEGKAKKGLGAEEPGPFEGTAEVNTAALGTKAKGDLSCLYSYSEAPAKGKLTLEKGGVVKAEPTFKLGFKTEEIEVPPMGGSNTGQRKFGTLDIEIINNPETAVTARGTANFTDPGNAQEKQKVLAKCQAEELEELKFNALIEKGDKWVGEAKVGE